MAGCQIFGMLNNSKQMLTDTGCRSRDIGFNRTSFLSYPISGI
jgi:hypothetical protein